MKAMVTLRYATISFIVFVLVAPIFINNGDGYILLVCKQFIIGTFVAVLLSGFSE